MAQRQSPSLPDVSNSASWATCRIRDDFGVVSLGLGRDAAGHTSRPEDVRSALRALPGWLRDSALRPRLLRLFEDLFGSLAVPRTGGILDAAPALSSAIESGRIVVQIDDLQLPAPTMVAPAQSDPKPSFSAAPAVETTWFQVRFVDEIGDPIDGLDVSFSLLGSSRKATTDAAGIVRLDNETLSTASVAVADTNALRDLLRPRWTEPRTAKLPTGPAVFVREIGLSIDPVGLDAEVPATVVIQPYFRCREVPGAHFEFGRSFVRRNAIPVLADIAEDLHGEPIRRGMIFAHTDKAGGDALNKELSERRARAVLALLTHDAAAWEELWTNQWSGGNWSELWGTRELQHLLTALHVPTEDGLPLVENGIADHRTTDAVKRFQRGEYPDKPAE